ncbi:MAG: transposase, partial [Azovibrio sp.]|nr:transposase [Azovibrio sp.]
MRGKTIHQGAMFSYVSLEDRIPKNHPLRQLRLLVDAVLASMDKEFEAAYAQTGRPSVPPERLLKAMLLQILFTIRSERLLVESIDYNLLYRWFVGLAIDDPVWDHST